MDDRAGRDAGVSNSRKVKRKLFAHAVIARYWRDYQTEHGKVPWGFMYDWGEPICFSCQHVYLLGGSECKYWQAGMECKHADPITHWNKSGLEKCHVVPLYMGGADEPSNIVLMCSRCHDAQPDNVDPQVTYDWMAVQPCTFVAKVKSAVDMAIVSGGSREDIKRRALTILGLSPPEQAIS
jgi:hypothetical protein